MIMISTNINSYVYVVVLCTVTSSRLSDYRPEQIHDWPTNSRVHRKIRYLSLFTLSVIGQSGGDGKCYYDDEPLFSMSSSPIIISSQWHKTYTSIGA